MLPPPMATSGAKVMAHFDSTVAVSRKKLEPSHSYCHVQFVSVGCDLSHNRVQVNHQSWLIAVSESAMIMAVKQLAAIIVIS